MAKIKKKIVDAMVYVCAKCGKKIENVDEFVRCTFCGGKILLKSRPNIAREVPTD